ncbi:predicted protein [Naegleria gruberi]|uniref:Predicted protein n=1 Tax=Naegleria gruberi TaxID=5762 RepID=D2V8U3_NAEGR|nr:uncharacterized protein NAEGRDRAFT_65283 [Naegleria gruberi]EFC46753.1 predicted protein [Naegleria gruberi]|eukprot:XP_002679497.1 predicted protein [Naegleria gruberi strain NEG-M]
MYSRTFEWASEELRSDKKLIMEALVKMSSFPALEFISDSLKKDQEFISKMIEQNPILMDGASEYNINFIKEAIRKGLKKFPPKKVAVVDRKEMLEKFKKKEIEFWDLPEKFKKDDEFCLIAIQRSLNIMQEIGPNLSREMIIKAVREASFLAFYHADENLKKDKLLIGRLIKIDPHVLLFADKEVRKDRTIISDAVKLDVETLNYATNDILKDVQFVQKIKSTGGSKDSKNHKEVILLALSYAPEIAAIIPLSLKKNKEFMLQAINAGGSEVLHHLHESLKDDKEFILKAIKSIEYCSMLAECLPESLLSDKEIVLAVVEKDPGSFNHFKNLSDIPFTREMILKVVKESASAYKGIPEEFKKDKEIALETMKGGLAYLISKVPDELKKDREFILKCSQENPEVVRYCIDDFRFDSEFCLQAIRLNGCVLGKVLIDKTREMEIEAVKQNGFFLPSSEILGELLKIRMEHFNSI